MKPIIIGVDPGTTAAYAVLDTRGNVLEVKSSRSFNLSKMIDEVIKHGNPVLVGCDKGTAPTFVEKIATKIGAELVVPEEDLSIDDKKRLASGDYENDHEMDALASAFHALNNYKGLFHRVDEVLAKEEKEHLSNHLKYLVVKEEMSIKKGIDYLEGSEEESEPEEENVRVEVIRPTEEIESLEKDITRLEQQNKQLRNEVSRLKEENQKLKERIKGMPVDQVVKEKEGTIQKLGDKLNRKEGRIRNLESEVKELKEFVADSSDKVLLKKLKNLSSREYADKEWMKFSEKDMLLVEDPNVASDEVIEELKDKVSVIITNNKVSINLPFTCINAKSLDLEEREDFALADKEQVEKKLSEKDVLKKVVLDYKNKRKI